MYSLAESSWDGLDPGLSYGQLWLSDDDDDGGDGLLWKLEPTIKRWKTVRRSAREVQRSDLVVSRSKRLNVICEKETAQVRSGPAVR